MSLLSLSEARALVVDEVSRALRPLRTEAVALATSMGRILAVDVRADRDQPPFPRSTRDGFAVRAADLTGLPDPPNLAKAGRLLRVIGEVAAGAIFDREVPPGAAVEIMTGAPVPAGADAVVMIEHTERPSAAEVLAKRAMTSGENIVPRGSELRREAVASVAGSVIDPAAIALLASIGCAQPMVFVRPRVAVVSTGDELVPLEVTPSLAQIRDSNRHCLAALIERAGGEPVIFPIVADDRAAIEATLAAAAAQADLVLVTGGVSMGKYDHVEPALATLSARVIFDGVAIRPGKPLVFGLLAGKPFFGLPGNPLSALVTFELFAKAAIALVAGRSRAPDLAGFGVQLAEDYAQKSAPLTVFAPARLLPLPAKDDTRVVASFPPAPRVVPVSSQGSGDLTALSAADGFLIVPPGTASLAAGSWVLFLPK